MTTRVPLARRDSAPIVSIDEAEDFDDLGSDISDSGKGGEYEQMQDDDDNVFEQIQSFTKAANDDSEKLDINAEEDINMSLQTTETEQVVPVISVSEDNAVPLESEDKTFETTAQSTYNTDPTYESPTTDQAYDSQPMDTSHDMYSSNEPYTQDTGYGLTEQYTMDSVSDSTQQEQFNTGDSTYDSSEYTTATTSTTLLNRSTFKPSPFDAAWDDTPTQVTQITESKVTESSHSVEPLDEETPPSRPPPPSKKVPPARPPPSSSTQKAPPSRPAPPAAKTAPKKPERPPARPGPPAAKEPPKKPGRPPTKPTKPSQPPSRPAPPSSVKVESKEPQDPFDVSQLPETDPDQNVSLPFSGNDRITIKLPGSKKPGETSPRKPKVDEALFGSSKSGVLAAPPSPSRRPRVVGTVPSPEKKPTSTFGSSKSTWGNGVPSVTLTDDTNESTSLDDPFECSPSKDTSTDNGGDAFSPKTESDLEPLAGKAEEKKPKFIEHREPTKSKGVLKKHIFKKKKKKVDPDEELKNIATTLGQITSEKPDEESEEWKAFQEMQNRISGSVQLAKEKVEVLKSTESEIKEAVEKTQDYVVPSWEDFDREKRENKGEVEDIKIPELPPIAPLPMIKTIPEQPRGQQMKVEPTKKMPPKKPDPPKAMPPKKPAPPKVIPKVVPADIQGDEELNLELRIVESGDEEEKVKEEDPFDDEFLNLSQRSVPDEGNKDAFSLSGSGGGTDLPGVHAPVKTMTSLEKELLGLSVEEPVADNSGTAKSTVDSIVDDFLGISSTTQPLQPSKPIIGDDLFGLSHKEKVEADLQETALIPALLPQPAVINPILASPIHVADPGDIFSSASDATHKAAEPGDLFGEPLEPTKVESTVDPFTVNLDKIQKEQEQKVEDDFDPRALDDDDELDFDPRSEKDLPKDLAVSTKPTEAVWGDSAPEEPGEFKAHLLESEKAMEQAQQAAEEAGAFLKQPKRNPFLSEDSGFSSSNPFSANTDMESMFPDSGFNASVSKAKEPTTGEVDPFLCLMGNNDTSKPAADFETIAEGDDAFDPFQTITDDGEPHMPGFSSFNADSFDLGMNDTSKDTDKNKSDNVTATVSDNVAPVDNLIDIPGLAPVVKDTPKSAESTPTTTPKVDDKPQSKKEEAKQEEPKKEVQSVEKQDNKYEVKKEHIIPRRRTVAPPSPKIIKPEIIPVPRKRAKDIDITAPKEVTIKPLDTTTAEALPIAPALPPPPTPIIEEYSTSDDSSPEKSPKKSCSFDGTPNLEYEAIAKEIEEIDKAKPVKERRNSETYEDDYDELEKLEPLPPYHPKFEGEGWSLLMRIGKKKMTKERAWRPCFVRLIENQGRFTLRVFNTEEEKHPLHEVQLAPNFNMSDVKLQYYDDYGKIHIFKLYSVTYKERVGFKAERLAPSQIKANFQTFKKAVMRHPKTTDLIDHSKVKTELFKFGCKDRPMICSLVQEIEDALMKVVATRGSPQTYIKDECNAEIWDEYEGTLDKSGHIENQKGRVRIFYKAFINDHPKVELGINDKRRRGKEVVRRKDIVPVKTDEWIRIETPEFHNCVDMKEWNENQMIIFTPLDAIESELMRFRVRPKQNFQLPLQVRVQMVVKERHVEIRSDVIVPGYFNMKRKHSQVPCEDIMIRFPLPEAWIYLFRTEKHFRYGTVKSIRKKPGKIKGLDRLAQMAQGLFNYGSIMEVSTGQAKYEHIYRSIVWRISRLPELNQGAYKEHIFILRLDLGPHDIMPETYEQYAEVEFTMPNTTVSKCAVRSIAVEGPDDPPEKWVNYLSKYEYKVEIEFKTGDTPEDVPAYAITPTSPTEKKEVPEYPEYNPDEPDDSSSSDED